ncbi:hypothetical protein LEP1GSC168_2482 [Leptospira santarosai str. HAI134]|uniref:Uncharacterized protein n=1 Tax=Leptospira santarosai str. ZUN179 TaxID=1049985 RepID=M6V1S6_9LEPT|nr:hypothetical protein LEP1GSC168_2482 [Leptospira santarosai str. HAI134]EMO43483.1 hypothetical protein LEP1GSC187_3052 [Leptospira santarosai str. ZUN179]
MKQTKGIKIRIKRNLQKLPLDFTNEIQKSISDTKSIRNRLRRIYEICRRSY